MKLIKDFLNWESKKTWEKIFDVIGISSIIIMFSTMIFAWWILKL